MGSGSSREEAAAVSVPEAYKEEPKRPATTTTTVPIPADVLNAKEETSKGSNLEPVTIVPKAKDEPQNQKEHMQVSKNNIAEKSKKLPHMYEAIINKAGNPSNGSLLGQIRSSGIFLNNNNQKYWVDAKTGHNCFMLFARDLLITWSENQNFWQWASLKEQSGVEIEIASLLNVCWLEVHGKFETSYLTPKVMYEVLFVVMMELGYGWAKPVKLRLKLPNGNVQQHEECLLEAPKGQWIELKAGEIMAENNVSGQMEFSLYEYEGGQWKRGLIVQGAIIRPKSV